MGREKKVHDSKLQRGRRANFNLGKLSTVDIKSKNEV